MTISAKQLKTLASSFEKLADSLNKIANSLNARSAPSPKKPAPKRKSAKAPAKKSFPKKKPAKAKPQKVAKQPTKTDDVLQTIRRARNGLDTATLKKRTGFDGRTISNAVYKLRKENKIKSPKKGLYIKV
jgi:hypothetical protein